MVAPKIWHLVTRLPTRECLGVSGCFDVPGGSQLSPAATVQDSTSRSFVGRRREIVELSSSLDGAIAGHGRLFLISGEPGIGKTWLADEVARHAAERGMRVAWGRCWEGGGAPAYWPWMDIVRTLVLDVNRARAQHAAIPPEIGQLMPGLSPETVQQRVSSDPEQARFRLFDAVATLLKQVARSDPLVLILGRPARGRPQFARIAQVRCAWTHRLSHRSRRHASRRGGAPLARSRRVDRRDRSPWASDASGRARRNRSIADDRAPCGALAERHLRVGAATGHRGQSAVRRRGNSRARRRAETWNRGTPGYERLQATRRRTQRDSQTSPPCYPQKRSQPWL